MVEGQTYENKKIETLSLMGRNAMTWDDNRKAAAYVTSKDPGVLNFARSVSSYIRSKENRSICDNLQAAIAFHEALDLYGMNYTPNPKTPYSEVSKQKDVVDFLQFPRETFQYKAGDCSDLSILYASLFQAVGIDAAFITVPGHIFIAVDTCFTPEQAPKELIPESQFIAYKNKAWIPLEITAIHDGFMRAWQLGAKEWTENNSSGQAGFYPIQEAWAVYQPVGFTGADITISVPQSDTILRAYQGEIQKYLDAALAPMVASCRSRSSNGSLVAMNSLGVLYAKYGQSEKAEQEFKQMLDEGGICLRFSIWGICTSPGKTGRMPWSCTAGERDDPSNPHTLLALARVNQELQNYVDAKNSYERLKESTPALPASLPTWGGKGERDQGGGCGEPTDISHLGDGSVRRAPIVGVIFFALAVCGLGAQELSVSYAEGDVQVRSGSRWAALSIGDWLSPQATIQLGGGAYVELTRADSRIVLSQKGTYNLRDILASSHALDSAGARKALLQRCHLIDGVDPQPKHYRWSPRGE